MAMLSGVADLTLARLNEITQAWVEQDYHRTTHSEIGTSPLRRYLDSPCVGRDCPDSDTLRRAFRCTVTRRQRRSDGTVSLAGKRFEVPSRYRHLERVRLHYARWDLSGVELIDPHTLKTLCRLYPLDKSANANGLRRALASAEPDQYPEPLSAPKELPPLLRKLLADYAATGRPPAYLPKHDDKEPTE
jgi:hypothetical protein